MKTFPVWGADLMLQMEVIAPITVHSVASRSNEG